MYALGLCAQYFIQQGLMQRLVSATNKCAHKRLSIHSCLFAREANPYVSHEFATASSHYIFVKFCAAVHEKRVRNFVAHESELVSGPEALTSSSLLLTRRGHTLLRFDYYWRPHIMESFPSFFRNALLLVAISAISCH